MVLAFVTMFLLLAGSAAAYGWYRLAQPFVTAAQAPPVGATASPDRLERHVRKLSVDFSGRSFDKLMQLEGSARYIESEFSALGLAVQSQSFRAQGRSYRNLVVALGPDTREVLVIGAHYDVANEKSHAEGQPGADDNASGVAGLIELARLLKDQPLRQRIELVVFANEEPPFFRTPGMGSAVHARSLTAAGRRASLMLALECIGYFSDEPGSQAYPVRLLGAVYPSTGNFIALVGRMEDGAITREVKAALLSASNLPVASINAPAFVVGVDFSDHLNYWREGFAGMMLTDTAFYRNKAYHSADDTADRLDYGRMAKVIDGVRAVALQQAGLR